MIFQNSGWSCHRVEGHVEELPLNSQFSRTKKVFILEYCLGGLRVRVICIVGVLCKPQAVHAGELNANHFMVRSSLQQRVSWQFT